MQMLYLGSCTVANMQSNVDAVAQMVQRSISRCHNMNGSQKLGKLAQEYWS